MTIHASATPASPPAECSTATATAAAAAAAASDLLADSLLDSLRRLARQEHRTLMLLREFDLHRAYAGRGARSTPGWLQATLGTARETTRERLRVAYALLNLPGIDAAFASGALSYAKVRTLSGTATALNEDALLAQAATLDEPQLERHCAARRAEPPAPSIDADRKNSDH